MDCPFASRWNKHLFSLMHPIPFTSLLSNPGDKYLVLWRIRIFMGVVKSYTLSLQRSIDVATTFTIGFSWFERGFWLTSGFSSVFLNFNHLALTKLCTLAFKDPQDVCNLQLSLESSLASLYISFLLGSLLYKVFFSCLYKSWVLFFLTLLVTVRNIIS